MKIQYAPPTRSCLSAPFVHWDEYWISLAAAAASSVQFKWVRYGQINLYIIKFGTGWFIYSATILNGLLIHFLFALISNAL